MTLRDKGTPQRSRPVRPPRGGSLGPGSSDLGPSRIYTIPRPYFSVFQSRRGRLSSPCLYGLYTMTETIPPDGSKNKPKLGVSRPRITHKVCRGAGHVTEFLQKQVDLGVRGSDFMKELPKDARSDVKACLEYIRGLVTYGKAKFEGKTNDG